MLQDPPRRQKRSNSISVALISSVPHLKKSNDSLKASRSDLKLSASTENLLHKDILICEDSTGVTEENSQKLTENVSISLTEVLASSINVSQETDEDLFFAHKYTSLRSSEDELSGSMLIAQGSSTNIEHEDTSNSGGEDVEESDETTSSSENLSLYVDTDSRDADTLSALADWGEEDSEASEVEEMEVFNPYTFIKNLPAKTWPCVEKHLLPPRAQGDHRICLVLDLDETLVHCSTEPLHNPDLVFPVIFNDVTYTVYARKRPFIEKFLMTMSSLFEIVVFTASQEVYADKLLNILDPERKYIKHRLFRDSCIFVDNNYLKDLTLLGRDLSQTIIVDNSPQAFGYHIDNGIPIESWFDDEMDTELLACSTFLESLISVKDVRPYIREKYKLHELVSCA